MRQPMSAYLFIRRAAHCGNRNIFALVWGSFAFRYIIRVSRAFRLAGRNVQTVGKSKIKWESWWSRRVRMATKNRYKNLVSLACSGMWSHDIWELARTMELIGFLSPQNDGNSIDLLHGTWWIRSLRWIHLNRLSANRHWLLDSEWKRSQHAINRYGTKRSASGWLAPPPSLYCSHAIFVHTLHLLCRQHAPQFTHTNCNFAKRWAWVWIGSKTAMFLTNRVLLEAFLSGNAMRHRQRIHKIEFIFTG